MALSVFLTTFGLVFIAELGDKTQLTAVALAMRYPWKKAFLGIATAFAVLNAVAVAVGAALFKLVPHGWIQLVAAALFLVLGVRTLVQAGQQEAAAAPEGTAAQGGGAGAEGSAAPAKRRHGAVWTAFTLILVAELGDKTQLLTAALAARYARPFVVFAASTLALWLVSLLGLLVGAQLARRVPVVWVHRAAGAAFCAFGLASAFQGARSLGLLG